MSGACSGCLARTWLLGRLAGHLDPVRGRILELLALAPEPLIEAVGGELAGAVRGELARLAPDALRGAIEDAGLETICRCEAAYPGRLRELESPPAVLHIAGGRRRFLDLVGEQPVAVVGTRRASPYGIEVARGLGRGLAAAQLTVLSGMALGVDGAAALGALDAAGPTVAILPGGAERPYPASHRSLYRAILRSGVAVSELAPGTTPRRWMFPARNRIIAALGAMTVVVEARAGSGALLTSACAQSLGRPVGAVPGRVNAPQAEGPHALLADGARLVRGAQDVLDHLFGAGARAVSESVRPKLEPEQARLWAALAEGHDTATALARAGIGVERGLAALAALELEGYVSRGPGGRYSVRG